MVIRLRCLCGVILLVIVGGVWIICSKYVGIKL